MISNTETGTIVYAKNNTQATGHPFWSALGAYTDDSRTDTIRSCGDDDVSPSCITTPDCDWNLEFADLDKIDAAGLSDRCKPYYILGALDNMLGTTLDSYAGVDDGYDGLFPDYVRAPKLIPSYHMTGLSLTPHQIGQLRKEHDSHSATGMYGGGLFWE